MGILTFIIVLGILIFVHEFGHFYFAKRAGVGVETFSIGFGPKLFSVQRGETEYRIALIPLGGYVKMMGDSPGETSGNPKDFSSRPIRDRLPIVLAGPGVNVVVAFLLMPLVYIIGVQVPTFISQPPVVGYVVPDTPAHEAGIQEGDRIVSIDGQEMETWQTLLMSTLARPDTTIQVRINRDGETVETPVHLTLDDSGAALFGVQPPAAALIGEVSPGTPAERAGLQKGDRIIALNGEPVAHWIDMANRIQEHGEAPLEVTYVREGVEDSVTMTPQQDGERVVMGVLRMQELELERYGIVESIQHGFSRTALMAGQTFEILGRLVTGQLGVKTLGGPVRIAQVTSAAADSGFADVLSLMAFLSLQLGILNLLPFPVLDGGHVMFMGIEAVRRKPLSRRALEIFHTIGFVLLITLMLVVTKNDIMYAWGSSIERFFENILNLF